MQKNDKFVKMSKKVKKYWKHAEVSGRVFEMKDKKKGDKTLQKSRKIGQEEDLSKKKNYKL